MKRALEQMGPVRTARTLSKLNQTDGFDCMSCAWPDPDHRHTAEDLRRVAATLNKRPRPTLDLQTPAMRLNTLLTAA
jgi:hypothetical protein